MLHQSDFSLMQGVAWLGMLTEYTVNETSFEKALEQTFDGQDPCELCHFIQESQDSEKSESLPETVKKKKAETSFSLISELVFKTDRRVSFQAENLFAPYMVKFKSQCHFEVALPPPKA